MIFVWSEEARRSVFWPCSVTHYVFPELSALESQTITSGKIGAPCCIWFGSNLQEPMQVSLSSISPAFQIKINSCLYIWTLLSILEIERVALHNVITQQSNGSEGPFSVALILPSFQVILREASLQNLSQWSRHMVKEIKQSRYWNSLITETTQCLGLREENGFLNIL